MIFIYVPLQFFIIFEFSCSAIYIAEVKSLFEFEGAELLFFTELNGWRHCQFAFLKIDLMKTK